MMRAYGSRNPPFEAGFILSDPLRVSFERSMSSAQGAADFAPSPTRYPPPVRPVALAISRHKKAAANATA
jgi:hypothetical protein